ncbi:IclR family transcriptional regulator C-terminal domain-containing protein [Microbacterium sp. 1P10AE]|uniref:IclR family transcriptional regulator domain-containing protein n=1 Tax=Microbacterium sp. 1P10AE TaxID=3132286 RepID=UPI00399FAF8F
MTDAAPLDDSDGPGEVVQAFVRGLAVIRAFDANNPELTLSDVARRADVTRAAAGRFLRTLQSLGYVRNDGRSFALTPRVLELGYSYLSALSLPEVAQPHLEALSRAVGESASAAVLDGTEIVYVARVPVRRIMSVGITVGTRFPAAVTSMGRVLLAAASVEERDRILDATDLSARTPRTLTDPDAVRRELERVRAQGWARVDGELEPGLQSLAAPVHGREGAVVAAINLSMTTGRYPESDIADRLVPALLAAARGIEADLRTP